MSILIGTKSSKDNDYLYAPYLEVVKANVEGKFSPKMSIASRYGNDRVKKVIKIKKILDKIEDLNITSS